NESPYKGGKFLVDIKFVDYPMRHPEIKFDTLVYHPNIDQQGKICIGILKEWKPTNKMEGVLSALTSFLNEPDPEDPLDAEIARIYKEEPDTFKSTAATWTKRVCERKCSLCWLERGLNVLLCCPSNNWLCILM
ncbi:ubiquitin-conjugating enzyme/RWD-like protein, partial [Mortierella sp. GBAus27b]